MRSNVVLSMYNRATYLDQTKAIIYVKKTCSQVLFTCAIFHTSKHFGACVDVCTCDRTSLLKRPVNIFLTSLWLKQRTSEVMFNNFIFLICIYCR